LTGAFWSAAAALSVVVVAVLYPNYFTMTGMLLGIAFLYALCAVWLRWTWVTLAALAALNLAVFTGVLSVVTVLPDILRVSAIAFAAVGIALVAVGVELKRRGWIAWRRPLYLVAGLDLLLAFAFAAVSSDALIAAVSAAIAVASLAMQWVEREEIAKLKLPPVLTYVGALALFAALYFATRALNVQVGYVTVVIAAGSALMVGAALGLQRAGLWELYGRPVRYVGLLFAACVLPAALVLNVPLAGALTYAIVGAAFGADGWMRKQVGLVYASGAAFVGAFWWLLRFYANTEWQAFVIPLGVLCLAIGWSEARRGRMIWFQIATLAGLTVMLASAFYQSLSNVSYAVLLLVESIAAFGIGIRMHSRIYVEAAILALVLNGLAQFGPAFVNLERWIQIGTIGTILLVIGLVALFRRQRLLEVRRTLTSEWKMWRP
jgi:hypothetical protein